MSIMENGSFLLYLIGGVIAGRLLLISIIILNDLLVDNWSKIWSKMADQHYELRKLIYPRRDRRNYIQLSEIPYPFPDHRVGCA